MATVEELEMRLQAAEATIDQLEGTPLPQGAQVSFPVTGHQANMPEWMGMFQALANGVIDHGGSPFRMSVSDVDDSITVHLESNTGANEALVRGIGYRQSSEVKLYAPAVSSTTRYMVGIEYDPAKETDPLRAVQLVCIPLSTWRIASPKIRFKLVSFDRAPSQVLSAAWAGRQEHKMRLSPTVFAASVGALPTRAEGALWGQTAIVGPTTGPWDFYICVGGAAGQEWVNLSSPDWENIRLNPARKWAGFGYVPKCQKLPGVIRVRGVFKRSDDSAFTVSNSGWHLGQIEGVSLPGVLRWGGATGLAGGYVLVETNGDIVAYPSRDVWTIGIDGLTVYTK